MIVQRFPPSLPYCTSFQKQVVLLPGVRLCPKWNQTSFIKVQFLQGSDCSFSPVRHHQVWTSFSLIPSDQFQFCVVLSDSIRSVNLVLVLVLCSLRWTLFLYRSRSRYVFRLSVPFSWTRYLRNTLREFLQIWHKRPHGLKEELVWIWWSEVKVQGHCDIIMSWPLFINLDPKVLVCSLCSRGHLFISNNSRPPVALWSNTTLLPIISRCSIDPFDWTFKKNLFCRYCMRKGKFTQRVCLTSWNKHFRVFQTRFEKLS